MVRTLFTCDPLDRCRSCRTRFCLAPSLYGATTPRSRVAGTSVSFALVGNQRQDPGVRIISGCVQRSMSMCNRSVMRYVLVSLMPCAHREVVPIVVSLFTLHVVNFTDDVFFATQRVSADRQMVTRIRLGLGTWYAKRLSHDPLWYYCRTIRHRLRGLPQKPFREISSTVQGLPPKKQYLSKKYLLRIIHTCTTTKTRSFIESCTTGRKVVRIGKLFLSVHPTSV